MLLVTHQCLFVNISIAIVRCNSSSPRLSFFLDVTCAFRLNRFSIVLIIKCKPVAQVTQCAIEQCSVFQAGIICRSQLSFLDLMTILSASSAM